MTVSQIFHFYHLDFVNRTLQCGMDLIFQFKHNEGEILNCTRPETSQNMVLLSYANLSQIQRQETNTSGRDTAPVFFASTRLRASATVRLGGA